jgi:hypothetical protein
MATPSNLVVQAVLEMWRPQGTAGDGRRCRNLYLSNSFTDLLNDPRLDVQAARSPTTPYEHLVIFADQFTCVPSFSGTGQFVRLMPHRYGVYEIKLSELRLFGWFWRQKQLILHGLTFKTSLMGRHDRVAQHIDSVVDFRRSLKLDSPEFMSHDFISRLL